MKTSNYLRNAALAVIFVMVAGFIYSGNENTHSASLNRDKAEFANAGYWIDPVVVVANEETSDEKLLAGKGYYIEPVVVTYDADKATLADKGYYIEPVVITYHPDVPEHLYASK
jgi:hypothetical protein